MAGCTISEKEINQAVENYFQSQGFKLLQWKLASLNDDGRMGYLGDHSNLEVTVRRQGHTSDEKVTFFVKTMPANPMQRELVDSCKMFRKEILFYDNVADRLISLLSKVRPMTPESKAMVIPRCYLTTADTLIMEDLHALNFKGLKAVTSLSLDYFFLTMRAIGQYHAASFALEEQFKRPLSEAFPDLLPESFLDGSPDHYLAGWHAASLKAVRAILPMLDKYKGNPEIVKKTQDAFPSLMDDLMHKFRAWPDARNVFCHGDLWINNLLFRTDRNEKPLEAVLVDYQLLRYAPPAVDLIMFLLFSCDKDFREEHMNEGLLEYHSELSLTLLQLHIEPDTVFPWEELQRTLKEVHVCGLTLMTMEYPFALAPVGELDPILLDVDAYRQHFLVDRTDFVVKQFNENQTFRTRFTEIMEEIIDDYILKARY